MSKRFIITDENGFQYGNKEGYEYYENAAETCANANDPIGLQIRDTWFRKEIVARFCQGASLPVGHDCDPEPDDSMDGDFDSGMASAGWGTDESYGYFGED